MLNQTLEELALNILIEGEFDTLPIKITHLAKVNRVDYLNNFEHEKFENCTDICQFILQSENMDSDREQAQKLAALVMAPKCVLKACKVSSAENLHVLTAVPIKIATDLYEHLNTSSIGERKASSCSVPLIYQSTTKRKTAFSQTIKKEERCSKSFLFFYLIPSKMTVLLFFAALFPFWKKYIRNSLVDITHTVGIISGIV